MKIEHGQYWDRACNPIVHSNCSCEAHCWAETTIKRFKQINPNPDKDGVGWYPDRLNAIKSTGKAYVWAMCWLGDLFHQSVIDNKFYGYIIEIIDHCQFVNYCREQDHLPPHEYLFLTKFPQNIPKFMYSWYTHCSEHKLWLGTSPTGHSQLIDQKRIDVLLSLPGFKKWLSIEPLIGPPDHILPYINQFSQVIVGGESGPQARPMHPDWVREIGDECQKTNVPFFFKQWGHYALTGRMLDGHIYNDLAWKGEL